ncbi:hypothetical protein D9611_013763 [Ephemerocybe angulata]|uniref:Uncharacterized protein n=1 Tax=Ephemerocybe angulata TaxID=980116 RepID=A0A8H5F201_9AGAR|nr:hypothetical protein D9611_013763 [Tulosesus angulatus]
MLGSVDPGQGGTPITAMRYMLQAASRTATSQRRFMVAIKPDIINDSYDTLRFFCFVGSSGAVSEAPCGTVQLAVPRDQLSMVLSGPPTLFPSSVIMLPKRPSLPRNLQYPTIPNATMSKRKVPMLRNGMAPIKLHANSEAPELGWFLVIATQTGVPSWLQLAKKYCNPVIQKMGRL